MKTLAQKFLKTIALLTALAAAFPQNAGATATFGQSSDLFNVGAGARAMGMGGAFTGVADDASASYYNPSGLAFMDEHQLMFMHNPLLMDSQYNYLASAHPLGDKWGALAVSDSLLSSDGYSVRDSSNRVTDGNGSLSNNVIFGSYAHKVTQKISAGLNLKFIQQKIVGFSDNALGMDIGAMYKPVPVFNIGASIANINSPSVTLRSSKDIYVPTSRLGVSSQVFKKRLLLAADVIKTQKESSQYAAGAEYAVNQLINLRGGFNTNRSYTLGMGLNIKNFRLDYAFSNTDIGALNKVSFTWAWHNIYKTELEPPMKEGRAIYPLSGFENQVVFHTDVPNQIVSNWSLQIRDKDNKEVRTLQGDLRPAENIIWDAKNNVGEPVVDGTYFYTFEVRYKNGKTWTNVGDVQLTLPDRKMKDAVDMSLQLNGAKENELRDAAAQQQEINDAANSANQEAVPQPATDSAAPEATPAQ